MAGGATPGMRELDQTPTWAVAGVCFVIIVISIVLEKFLHLIGHYFQHRKKAGLLEALEKVKAELMVLGFISLILTFMQTTIATLCIPERFEDTMLPCPIKRHHGGGGGGGEGGRGKEGGGGGGHRRLFSYEPERRFLAAGSSGGGCGAGKVPLISINGLHQLHIFIFFLAVFHVIYGAVTMTLGRLKIRGWKQWEQEAVVDQEFNDPTKFRLTHETSFVKDHTKAWTKTPVTFYLVCFFRQFFRSVRRADFLTMRHGFVSVHLAPGSKFNFQKYIKRSLEDDFKVVVGISPLLWTTMTLYLLLNVQGWEAMFVLSMLPLVIILAVGTKLQGIITQMAIEIQERHAVVQGIPLVQVTDKHFWFSWPELVLYLIHFVLFQNAFEITYFIWITYEFGLHSCFHENFPLVILRVALGVLVQIMCSYITLPLYALVTQMGSTMKKSIFDEQTNKALRNWQKNAHKKKTETSSNNKTSNPTLGGTPLGKGQTDMENDGATPPQSANHDLLTGP
ncbi:MLO-like protein 9 [Argentina anserina]|uniref:MLO-like protein 9 n=1 Tax=Argentina anserina TaxID=57926 RepID=UPI002176809F|nr:MLO-like protein 9 [Potentilla anserina]